jgi:hypothetical protein
MEEEEYFPVLTLDITPKYPKQEKLQIYTAQINEEIKDKRSFLEKWAIRSTNFLNDLISFDIKKKSIYNLLLDDDQITYIIFSVLFLILVFKLIKII